MSKNYRAPYLGAATIAVHLATCAVASGQEPGIGQQSLDPAIESNTRDVTELPALPAIVVVNQDQPKKSSKTKKKAKRQTNTTSAGSSAVPESADGSASVAGGAARVGDTGRADLDPNSPTNPMRLAKSSSGHTETITRKEIERLRPRDVFDLLNNAAGVVETQGSRKGFSGLTIRGDSNFIWLLDGAYLQPTMASRIMRSIPVNIIEQVTIVRGAAALTLAPLVGSATPGGAPVDGFIVVRTRRPQDREAELRTSIESNSTVQSGAWAGNTFERNGVRGYVGGSVAYSGSEGPSGYLDNGSTYNREYRSKSGLAKAGIDVSGWSFNLTAYLDDGMFQIPNANSHGPGQGSWYVTPSRTQMLMFSGSKSWSAEQTTLFNVSYIESDQTLWTANTPAGPYTGNHNPNYSTHANLRHNIDLATLRLSLGADYRIWNAPNGQQYYEGIQREEETYGGFIELEKRFFNDRLTVDAAVRYDRVNILHGLDYYIPGAQPVGGVNSPLLTTDVLLPWAKFYEFGASWKLTEDWKLTGRFGTSEQSSSGVASRPGVSLDDDSQIKIELGTEWHVNPWLNLGINLFHRAVENEKLLYGYSYLASNGSTQTCRPGVIPPSGPLSPQSTSSVTPCFDQANTTREGVELTASGRLWENGSYKANFTHFTNLENVETITPHNIAGLSLQQQVGSYLLTGTIKYVDKYKGARTDAQAWLGGYTRFDAGIGRDFEFDTTTVRATLYGRNLTNEPFETSNGIEDVGRVIGLEVLAKF